MKRNILLLLVFLACTIVKATNELTFWYQRPAANWNEAFSLGNGFLGAMVFGTPDKERFQLNECTLYSGEPASINETIFVGDRYNEILALMNRGKYAETHSVLKNDVLWNTWKRDLCKSPLGSGKDYRFKIEFPNK